MFEAPKINTLPPVVARTPVPSVSAASMAMNKDESITNKEDAIMKFGRNFVVVLVVMLGVSIIALLLGYYFMVINFDNKIAALQTEVASKQQWNDRLASWGNTVEALSADKEKFDQMVPAKKDLAQILVQLEVLAKKYNLVFNSIVNKTDSFTSQATDTKQFQTQSYEVTLSGGDYFTLKNYLSDIESSWRVIVPKSLIYSPDVNMFVLSFDIYHQ